MYGRVDKERAVEHGRRFDAWRQRAADLLHLGVDGGRHGAAVGADEHHGSTDHRLSASLTGAARPQLPADLDLGDILGPHWYAAARGNDDIANVVHALQTSGGA